MTGIEQVRVLHGHVSPETAYVVSDYPYGYTLRCTIRYWIETAEKGAKRSQQRFVSQTTNPRRPGVVWKATKGSIYGALTVMYLDSDDHVHCSTVSSDFGVSPEQVARWRLRGIHDQLVGETRRLYETYVRLSRRNLAAWERFDTIADAMAEHIRITGTDPGIDNGRWQVPAGLQYSGDNADVYLAVARERADTPPNPTTCRPLDATTPPRPGPCRRHPARPTHDHDTERTTTCPSPPPPLTRPSPTLIPPTRRSGRDR